ncbi:MAG: 2-oxo acid dehydrogenase subunit E2 [Candidatus Rokubacteria bacterium]|nr:2-oxo acid dehydrogenase subunit E2 [Candidatus Rokubacteria bacterium]
MAVTRVVMPKLSEAMESGKVIKWIKKEGDRVQGGDVLAEIETDKADVEMEAFGSGVLRKILVPAGERAEVGGLIAVIADANEDVSSVVGGAPARAAGAPPAPSPGEAGAPSRADERAPAAPKMPQREEFVTRTAPPPEAAVAPAEAPAPAVPSVDGERVKASPLARKIAAQAGVDLRLIQGSGPGGRVIRRDVEAAATGAARPALEAVPAPPAPARPAAPAAVAAAPAVEYEDVALSSMRAMIARRMPLSKAPVPHFYVTTEVAMDRAWELREQLNAMEGSPKISVNDFVIRACAIALLQHPNVNASFQGETVRVWHRAHIGIAVALDEGLITPVLRDAHAKSLGRIAVEARDLAERARARKLRAQEMSGATFSVSNLGMFGVTEFSAIINPPEGAILAVGAVRRIPVADEAGQLSVGRRMAMTLSCDHRVMDGAMGARFLADVKRLLEEPLRLVV